MHEAREHEENTFATFTYRPENLPIDGSLVPHHFQDFMKRLRRELHPKKVRYYHCGEYGDQFERPHYHAAIFGYEPDDQDLYGHSNGEPLYRSPLLEKLWTHGNVITGQLTFESAAYIARYCTKKVNGVKRDEGHYIRSCPITGETTEVHPEYSTMSNRPGIGADHFRTYPSDFFPSDEAVYKGRIFKPPRYYQKQFQSADPEGWEAVRTKRLRFATDHAMDNSDERLAAREKVKLAQFSQLKRNYDI